MREMPAPPAMVSAPAVRPASLLRRAVGEATPVAADESEVPIPERSQWERLQLADNIELHIRRPLSRPEQRRVERLITIARQVLDERNAP